MMSEELLETPVKLVLIGSLLVDYSKVEIELIAEKT